MSTDVRFWRSSTVPALKELNYYTGRRPLNQMKQKKTFVMSSNGKKPFGLHGLYIKILALQAAKGYFSRLPTST